MWVYYHFASNDGSTWTVHALNAIYAWEKLAFTCAIKKDGLHLVGYSLFSPDGYIYPMFSFPPAWLKK